MADFQNTSPAVFWTTFQTVTLGCEAAPEKANKSSDTPKKKKNQKNKKKGDNSRATINQEKNPGAKNEVVDFQMTYEVCEEGEKRWEKDCKLNKLQLLWV